MVPSIEQYNFSSDPKRTTNYQRMDYILKYQPPPPIHADVRLNVDGL